MKETAPEVENKEREKAKRKIGAREQKFRTLLAIKFQGLAFLIDRYTQKIAQSKEIPNEVKADLDTKLNKVCDKFSSEIEMLLKNVDKMRYEKEKDKR